MNIIEEYVYRLREKRRAAPSSDVAVMAREVCLGLLGENLNKDDKKKIKNILKQINYEKDILPIC